MALERVPADIRKDGGLARMSDPKLIKEIMSAVTIPVFAKCRIGHFVEAQILESLGVDMIDESEGKLLFLVQEVHQVVVIVLSPADHENHVDKRDFKVPFVCGARDLGEALRRIAEGAAMIRTKGEAGTGEGKVVRDPPGVIMSLIKGDVVNAVQHARRIRREIRLAQAMDDGELFSFAKQLGVPVDLLRQTAKLGRLPVVNFAAGGLATPADVGLLMQLGVDGVFVGSGIFKSDRPEKRAKAMVQAVTHYNDPEVLAKVSEDLGVAMVGINCDSLKEKWETRESMMK